MAAAPVIKIDDEQQQQHPDHEIESNNKRKTRPNKRHHEEQVEELMGQIRPLEERFRFLGRPPAADASSEENALQERLQGEQKQLREEKDLAIGKRKTMDDNLRVLNDKINKMGDSLSKLEAGLKFKTLSAIDDAIRKLDHQLQTRHFKYTEENRIVREIDSLRRSKKRVKEFQERRKECEEERDKKRKLKEERDKYFRMVSQLKIREDSKRHELTKLRSKENEAWTRYKTSGPERDALKKQIDQLYEQKRQLVADFRILQSEFYEHEKVQRAASLRKRQEEKKAFLNAKQKAWDEYEASLEPYEEECQMCAALIKYLRKFQSPAGDHIDDVSPLPSPSATQPPTSWKEDHKEFTILKKKTDDEDEVFLANSLGGKKRKSGKRSRKSSWINKPMRHSAQIFTQFVSLGLKAPTTAADLAEVLDQLHAKKQQYKDFTKSAMSSELYHRRHLSGSSTVSTTSSQATSEADSSFTSNVTSSHSSCCEAAGDVSRTEELVADDGGTSQTSGSVAEKQSFRFKSFPSLPKIQTKFSALSVSTASESLQDSTKTFDHTTVLSFSSSSSSSQIESNELALPAHRQEKEGSGDGSASSSATESTLPETPLSDISAPFENSGDGLDSGIDETRGGKCEDMEEGNDKDSIIDNQLLTMQQQQSDMNANVTDSTTPTNLTSSSEGMVVDNCHNSLQTEILRCDIGGKGMEEGVAIHHDPEECESFSVAVEHSAPVDVTL